MHYEQIKITFKEKFNIDPSLFRSPGRINLIGEHTDYNDGFVLPAAIDKEIIVAIAESGSDQCTVFSHDLNESICFSIQDIRPSDKAWANYFLGVIDQLNKKGKTIRGFNCVFGGNIPLGAGLSSSAALECVFVFAFDKLFDLGFEKEEMVKMAQMAEHEYAGVKCGIMDQFASMFGKKDHVFRLDCRSLEYKYFPLQLTGYEIILCNTKVEHSLASSEYNTRRRECETGVAALQKHYPEINSLRDVTIDQLETIKNEVEEVVFRRCKYVVGEIARVIDACEKLQQNNLMGFGKDMFETHDGLSNDYEVSCKELDFLVEKAKESGHVIGSRMMGGGFGGCTINIVKKEAEKDFISTMTKAYKDEFNIDLETYIVSIENGSGKL